MLPRCGRAAHICEANSILQSVFPAAIAFFKTCQFTIDYLYETSCKFGQGNGAIAARWQAKAGVEPPFAGRWRPFSLRAGLSEKFSVPTVPLEQLENICFPIRSHKAERSCSPRLEKLPLFSPPPPCAKSMAQGFRCLRAAIRATRPEPRQHFWKIAGSKNFLFACGSWLAIMVLRKNGLSRPAKGVPSLLLPASVLQLSRCLVRICNLFHKK